MECCSETNSKSGWEVFGLGPIVLYADNQDQFACCQTHPCPLTMNLHSRMEYKLVLWCLSIYLFMKISDVVTCYSLNSSECSRLRCSRSLLATRFGRGSIVIFVHYTSILCLFYLDLVVIIVFLIAAPMYDMGKRCNIEIAAQISRIPSTQSGMWILSA